MKRTPLRPISAKRRRLLPKRRAVVEAVRLRDGGCQARTRLPQIPCAGPLDVHELKRRSQDSNGWLIAEHCIALCRSHHRYVTEHPEHGHAVGLVVWSYEVLE